MLKENYNLNVELNGQKLNVQFNRGDLFRLTNFLVLPFWALMIIAPRAGITKKLMNSRLIFILLGGIYAALLVDAVSSKSGEGSATELLNPTLEGITRLLGTPQGAFTGWAHFLAFDLFVGRWIYQDSLQRGKTARLALLLTLFAGPLGLLFYLVTSGKKVDSNQ
jgi:Domain of unknown function (DUF4281)